MTPAESALLSLLCASLHGLSAKVPADTDWDGVLAEANAQAVSALTAEGLPDGLPEEQQTAWRDAKYARIANFVRYAMTQDELCRLLAAHDVKAVIVKGSAAAIYYPQPALRTMGDIDLVVLPEHYSRAKECLLEAGYRLSGAEADRHIAFKKDGVMIELHHRFSYDDLNIEDYIHSGIQSAERGTVEGHVFPILPRLANGLVLLAHMRSHIRVGLGLRQMIDWMMYVERELDDVFWASEFQAAAKAKKLDVLAITATRLCQKYLGLPERITWCAEADEALCKVLLESLLASGNFGVKDSAGNHAQGIGINIRNEGLFPYLQRVGERDWELYHRHRWLKPFAWLREGLVFFRKYIELRRKGKHVLSIVPQSSDRYEMMKRLKLY